MLRRVHLGVSLCSARRALRSSGRRSVGPPKAVPEKQKPKTVAQAPDLPNRVVDTLHDLTQVSRLEGTLHDIPHLARCGLREEVEGRPHPKLQMHNYAHGLDVEYTKRPFHVVRMSSKSERLGHGHERTTREVGFEAVVSVVQGSTCQTRQEAHQPPGEEHMDNGRGCCRARCLIL
jgi:hypothetical protein